MQFNSGSINEFGTRAKFFSAFSSDTTSVLGAAEIGQIKDFVPRFTYKVKWSAHMNAGGSVFIAGSGLGAQKLLPGIRIYGDLFRGATNGNVVEWQPITIYETHAQGEFILPQGGSAFAISFINMNGIDNADMYVNLFGERLSPIKDSEPWE